MIVVSPEVKIDLKFTFTLHCDWLLAIFRQITQKITRFLTVFDLTTTNFNLHFPKSACSSYSNLEQSIDNDTVDALFQNFTSSITMHVKQVRRWTFSSRSQDEKVRVQLRKTYSDLRSSSVRDMLGYMSLNIDMDQFQVGPAGRPVFSIFYT